VTAVENSVVEKEHPMSVPSDRVKRKIVLNGAAVFAVLVVVPWIVLGGPGQSRQSVTRAAEVTGPAKPLQGTAAGDAEAGFRPLFDGKSFAGWRVNDNTPKSWKIENGLLKLTGGSSHLFTKDEFDDFVVRFAWRPEKKGYNSGFLLRGRQIQIAQGSAGMLFGSQTAKAVPRLHKQPGEWNEWEVTCIGSKLSLKVNGTLAWEIDDFKPRRGPVGIEAEGHAIDFRDLRIKAVQK
jgi:hypothetical protein